MYKHSSRYTFGQDVYHVVTKAHGRVFGITLKENSMPTYTVIFEDDIRDIDCLESELASEIPTPIV